MKSQKERMLSGKLYIAEGEELEALNRRNRTLTKQFNETSVHELDKRVSILKELLGEAKDKIYIEPPFYCDYGSHISVGENFYANFDCLMLDVAPITIGNNVQFGPRVNVYTASHPIDAEVRNTGLEFGKPVTIGDNVWVGANAVINPGVTIGENTVIGSGSVVTKDIPENVVAAGNPCRVIRKITAKDKEYWKAKEKEYHEDMQK